MKNLSIIILILLLAASIALNIHQCDGRSDSIPISDTVRITIRDTIRYQHPVPTDSVVIGGMTIQGARVQGSKVQGSRVQGSKVQDSMFKDSIVLPIVQKRYEDSLYTAYVSGYRASLDSIFIHRTTTSTTITTTIPVKPKPSWNIGLQIGYGITVNRQPQYTPYIGIGLQYTIPLSFRRGR